MEEELQEDATIVLPVGMLNTVIKVKYDEFKWDPCSPRPALSNIQIVLNRWFLEVLDPDPVTRISKLDISDPLHLHPNDSTALTVISIKLKRTEKYQVWSCAMMLALEGKNKICFIDGSCKRSNTDEYDAMIKLPKCVCNASEGFKKHNLLLKLMQFLMGLDDSYMQIRSSILSREVFPYASAFMSNMPNSQNFQRSNQNFSAGPSRPNNLNNNRPIWQHDWHCRLGHPAEPVLNVLKESLQIDKKDNIGYCEVCQMAKQTREPFPLSDYTSKSLGDLVHLDLLYSLDKHQFIFSRDVKFFENIFPFKDSKVEKNDSANVFQDVNHINFFDIEYLEIPNDDERVANDLNKGKSDSSNSSVSGSNINTADFPVDFGNDADSSDELVATQNEEVATLEENAFSEGNLDQNPSSSHDVQNVRREPKSYFEASKYAHWIDAMNQEMDALLRNGT
ncbi:ribonuclease H-like domain-containing protein, partial [Tanacetum coccineum]